MYIWGEESKNLEASWTTQFLGRRTSQANKLLNGNKLVNRFTYVVIIHAGLINECKFLDFFEIFRFLAPYVHT